MIHVNRIEPLTVEHFGPDGKSLGFLNEYENLDLRCQIAEQKAMGFHLRYKGRTININAKGELNCWPPGMYDITQDLFARLFIARRKHGANG